MKPQVPDQVELAKHTKVNATDPDSQTIKTCRCGIQGYNGQAMVDNESQVIVANDVTSDANDRHLLAPILDRYEELLDELPGHVLGDTGYWSEENGELEDEDTELFIKTHRGQPACTYLLDA